MRLTLRLLAAAAALAAVTALIRRRLSARGNRDGLEYEGVHEPVGGGGAPDDAQLVARVESQLFRDPDLPKGDIVLDAVGGVVTLRGEVDPALVDDIPTRVAAVDGVARVESLLHAPGSPPPG